MVSIGVIEGRVVRTKQRAILHGVIAHQWGSQRGEGAGEGRPPPPNFHQKINLFHNFMQCLTFDPDTSNGEYTLILIGAVKSFGCFDIV